MAGFGAASFSTARIFGRLCMTRTPTTAGIRPRFGTERFLFDQGPHISFTKDVRIQNLFAGYVDQKMRPFRSSSTNYWRGLRLTHPVQLHLNGLPKDLIVEIIADFVKEHEVERKVKNYEDWLIASYGGNLPSSFRCNTRGSTI